MRHRHLRRVLSTLAIAAAACGSFAVAGAAAQADAPSASFNLTQGAALGTAAITDETQGFSVESADLAHGFLTKPLLGHFLKTLGPHGVIRLGGYSMDLVWPAFGAYANAPAPPQAIGGIVDQTDLDKLKALLDATGWQVTLGVPLKAVLDPAQIKSPTKDPSPPVTLDQAVAEVAAAYHTLGSDLLGVEVGNEFDNVTTLTSAQYYATLLRYHDAIDAAIPGADVKMIGPSANTSSTNTKLADFVAAARSDPAHPPASTLEELSSHYYPASHCGSSTTSVPALMSASTYLKARTKFQGMLTTDAPIGDAVPTVLNETNSASCSGMPGVSDAYATALWSLDYLLEAAQAGVQRIQFHTNTAAVCGDFQARDSVNYPISYRYYGAFCAADQAALDARQLTPAPLYYGLWTFRQVPTGRFVDLGLDDSALSQLRAYGVESGPDTLTVVLINPQDPASATSTSDNVALHLRSKHGTGQAVTLRDSSPDGLSARDPDSITLGDRTVPAGGNPSAAPQHTLIPVHDGIATVHVLPGTAQLVTFTHA